MSNLVRLRVRLANRPGSLADIAEAIAAHGANIAMIDAFDDGPDTAIDEITIDSPDSLDLSLLRTHIARVDGAQVLSYQLASPLDPTVRMLTRLAEHLDNPADALRRATADLLSTPAVWMMRAEDASAYVALEPDTAVVGRTTRPLPALGETISGEATVLALQVTALPPPDVIVAGRAVGQGFTPTESHRVEALAALVSKIAQGALAQITS